MTPDDRNSTSDASGATVLAALVAGNLEAARAFGLPADQLAARAGLAPADLADPDARVPLERFFALCEAIDAAPGSADFGFWLGNNASVAALGAVGFAMQHAPDVRAAFGCLLRFRRLISDQISPDIDEQGETVVFRKVEPPRIARLAGLGISAPLGTLTLIRRLAGVDDGRPLALEAAFQHPPPAQPDRHGRALGCPVAFNASETRLTLKREIFDLPLGRPDPGLFAYLQRHADSLQARVAATETASARVRELVIAELREGEPEQASVARRLGMSERTLQRRLQQEATSFASVVDEVRAQLAEMYLTDPRLAVFEVAFLLGYSEASAFNRAFRRWTGTSPRAYRQARA